RLDGRNSGGADGAGLYPRGLRNIVTVEVLPGYRSTMSRNVRSAVSVPKVAVNDEPASSRNVALGTRTWSAP
ncbi:MAG TPA: hypothetical protein VGD70_07120, partial [Actinophytocola sp.]